ncbi:shikimate dehydrogenase [Aurantimonas sp. MSK8Z-1]|uniref:shikimate dehydrogenase n=1 Tax=Mangrovibrevibacter kandeliae TaxID=2968473 RepID=UPI00211871DC|nr:shikimate dehydrogenase [Aurantimonas sp. MSK8Z-1]MCW4115034.1 shikimate dehydrogenase [Aurantimonas sp. MSK8Z-1]
MTRAFVTGWPVAHSRSPLIHGHWLSAFGIEGSYEKIAVPPEKAPDFFGALPGSGFAGGNVTVPHKETALRAASRLDATAAAIGAVNTLWLEDGTLCGGNTDAYGFAANLDALLPGWDGTEDVVILGAGGAARAVLHAVLDRSRARVRVINRTVARAEALAEAFGPRVSGHGEGEQRALLRHADLLVNTVSKDMAKAAGDGDALPELDSLPDHAMVSDIVYVPLETPLLRAARRRGLAAADGLGMLLHQAVPGFERWFGVRPEVTAALRDLVVSDIERVP